MRPNFSGFGHSSLFAILLELSARILKCRVLAMVRPNQRGVRPNFYCGSTEHTLGSAEPIFRVEKKMLPCFLFCCIFVNITSIFVTYPILLLLTLNLHCTSPYNLKSPSKSLQSSSFLTYFPSFTQLLQSLPKIPTKQTHLSIFPNFKGLSASVFLGFYFLPINCGMFVLAFASLFL